MKSLWAVSGIAEYGVRQTIAVLKHINGICGSPLLAKESYYMSKYGCILFYRKRKPPLLFRQGLVKVVAGDLLSDKSPSCIS